MKRLYLVRHGDTDYTLEKIIQGSADIPLNNLGRQQALDLVSNIIKFKFDMTYVSPMKRTIDTFKAIQSKIDIDSFEVVEGLRTIDFGDFEHKTWESCKLYFPEEYIKAKKLDIDYRFPKGESGRDHQKRILEFLKNYIEKEPFENYLLITHLGTINLLTGTLLKMNPKDFYKLPMKPCDYRILLFNENDYTAKIIQDK